MAKKKENKKAEPQFDLRNLSKQEIEALAAAKTIELREQDKKFMEDKEREEKREEKNKKIRNWLKIIILILIMLLLLVRCSQLPLPEQIKDIVDMGFENTVGRDEVKDDEEEEPYDARESLLTISMNKVPVFYNGISPAKLCIENDARNVYYQYVEIYLNDENGINKDKLIYKSNLIDIGQYLETDSLDVILPAGTYKATACFHAVRPETMEKAGEARCQIEITVMYTADGAVDLNSEWWIVEEAEETSGENQ